MEDDISRGAFSGSQAFLLAVLLAVSVVTYGLYFLGLPARLTGVVFITLLIGTIALSHPLYKRFAPAFD